MFCKKLERYLARTRLLELAGTAESRLIHMWEKWINAVATLGKNRDEYC